MVVRLGKIPNTGAVAFLHSCENCNEWGCFGIGGGLNKALYAIDKGKVGLGKELLGKWYCLTHWRKLHENN